MTRNILIVLCSAILSILGSAGVNSQLEGISSTSKADVTLTSKVSQLNIKAKAQLKRACVQRAALTSEVNSRGDILREFLVSAGEARQRSAVAEASTSVEQSNIDFQAATDYKLLAARVHDLPAITC